MSDQLEDMIAGFQKDYGDEVLQSELRDCDRLPFGIFALDVALGGGIPIGRVTILYGPEAAGKSNHALCLIREFQKRYPDKKVVLFDIEQTMTKKWVEAFGVNEEGIYILRPANAEHLVNMTEKVLLAEDTGLVITDSLASTITLAELDRDAETANVGGSGLAIGKLVRKSQSSITEANKQGNFPTVVWINQIRTKVGAFAPGGATPETMPGGKAPSFQASCILRLSGKSKKDTKVDAKVPALRETRAVVKKNKFAIVNPEATYDMVMIPHNGLAVGRTRDFPAVKSYAQDMGLLVKGEKGGWIFGGVEYPTLDAFWDDIRENIPVFDELKSKIIASLMPDTKAVDPGKPKLKFKKKLKVKAKK